MAKSMREWPSGGGTPERPGERTPARCPSPHTQEDLTALGDLCCANLGWDVVLRWHLGPECARPVQGASPACSLAPSVSQTKSLLLVHHIWPPTLLLLLHLGQGCITCLDCLPCHLCLSGWHPSQAGATYHLCPRDCSVLGPLRSLQAHQNPLLCWPPSKGPDIHVFTLSQSLNATLHAASL